jgi:arylsulfatase A-like enzyme
MSTAFNGKIAQDIRDSEPDWGPYRAAKAPTAAPNVLYLLWDDIGIGTWDSFGGLVDMPNMKRIADRGVRLTQFHTTALCSPTRAALLTGRNPTSVGMSSVENLAEGFPGHHGRIPAETALVSEVLAELGWATYAVGKWHLAPMEDCHAAGSRRYWPLARGFDRYYGFLDGMTDQWYPNLVSDNHPVDTPATPANGYHLSQDLADRAIEFLRDSRAAAPDKPWFMYLCPGAGHSPHQVAGEWADNYRGRFDMGYERYREIVLANQKAMGIVRADTELSPMNPYADATGVDGSPWPAAELVRPWDSLSDDEKRVSCRLAEVFAGFLSYTDAQIGRVLDYLERTGQSENTIIVAMSDNGASGEGGPDGSIRDAHRFKADPADAAEALRIFDRLGGPETDMNYSNGWGMAFNTPYKMFKRHASHEGGIADPCVISWPNGIGSRGELRHSYAHVTDITPTVYELLGIDAPTTVKGIAQAPLEGVSFRSMLADPSSPVVKKIQFYSMMGTRGIWHDGWFAGTVHPPASVAPRGWSHYDEDRWELFHIEEDRSQVHDLADEYPAKLAELKDLWQREAEAYRAFPLNDLSGPELFARGAAARSENPPADRLIFYPDTPAQGTAVGGLVRGRSFTLSTQLAINDADAQGVIFSQGNRVGGQVLYLKSNLLHYVYNCAGVLEQAMVSRRPITVGTHQVGVRFVRTGSVAGSMDVVGDAELVLDDEVVASYPGLRMAFPDTAQAVSAGRSTAHSVTPDYTSPFPLTGGTIEEVTLDFTGSATSSPDSVLDAAFARD